VKTNTIFFSIALISLSILACGVSAKLPLSETIPTSETLPASLDSKISMGLVTAVEALEVRQGPTEHSPGTGYFLLYGQTVELLGSLLVGTDECPAGWLRVQLGYICAGYVK
jgi:hypothetical protein